MIVFKFILAFIRMFLFLAVASIVYGAMLFTNLFFKDKNVKLYRGLIYRRFIIRCILVFLGIKLISKGKEFNVAGLIVFNHRSYFDPVVILKNLLAYPIGKKEVESWPLIGNVCKTTGVIFVKREERDSRKDALKKMSNVLKNGYSILLAPEGTTHINPATGYFKPGGFRVAAQLGIPILPIAIDYKNINDAWIGNDTFIPHFFRCFGKLRTEIKVSYLKPIYGDNVDKLIAESKKAIDAEMLRFRKEWELN